MWTKSAPPADAFAGTLRRTLIERVPFSVLGRDIVQVRTEIPAGHAAGRHTHRGDEVGYIVAGNTYLVEEGQPLSSLAAGPS